MGLQAGGGRDSQNLPRTPGSLREPAREHSSLIAVQIGSPGGQASGPGARPLLASSPGATRLTQWGLRKPRGFSPLQVQGNRVELEGGWAGSQRPQTGEEHKDPVRNQMELRSHHASGRPCFGYYFWKGLKDPSVAAQASAAPAPGPVLSPQEGRRTGSRPGATAPAPKGGVRGPAG